MDNAITVMTSIALPKDKVWELWTGPEHITKWCAASDDWEAPKAENDVRVDGKFNTLMAAKDKSSEFEFSGTYTEVNEPELLMYTMDDGRKVHISFEQSNEGTKVTEQFEPEMINPLTMQQEGWQAILDNFKKYAENHSSK